MNNKIKKISICLLCFVLIFVSIWPINFCYAESLDTNDVTKECEWITKDEVEFNADTYSSGYVNTDYGYTYTVKDTGKEGNCDSSGLYVDNGYLQLSHSNSDVTPITNSINFDITLDFAVDSSTYDLGTTSKYLIFATGYSATNYGWIGGDNESTNISFKQFINSNMYSDGVELAQTDKAKITTANLTAGKKYTYNVKYDNNNLKVTLSDGGTVLYTFCNINNIRINTSQINTFLFGDDDGTSFTSGITYKHLTVRTKEAPDVNFNYGITDSDNNSDTFLHSDAHDPTAVACIEAYYKNGSDEVVRDYPEDYETYYNTTIPDSVTENGKNYVLDSQKKAYYIFGTHFNNERSYDMQNWKQISSIDNITMFNYKSYTMMNLKNAYPEFDIMCDWSAYENNNGDCWAGDIIWNYEHNCWTYYGSVTYGKIQSTIFFASSNNLTSGFVFGFDENDHTDCFTMVSGLTKSSIKHPFLKSNIDFRFSGGKNDGYVSNYFAEYWDDTSNSKYGNSIDPCVFYDKDGNLWMSYGSWCNGLWVVPINKENCTVDLEKMITNTASYKNNNNKGLTSYDIYHGVKIVNIGKNSSGGNDGGEGSFIIYDKENDIYILTVSFGWIEAAGGYNLKVYTSKSPDGPYYDTNNNMGTSDSLSTNNTSSQTGAKLIGDYSWECNNYTYSSMGHNSLIYTDTNEDGIKELYNIYHSRYLNNEYSSESNKQLEGNAYTWNDFVHSSYIVPSVSCETKKTMVTMPYEFSGETLPTSTSSSPSSISKVMYSAKQISGYYEYINHGSVTSTSVNYPSNIKVAVDKISDSQIGGTISGAVNGTITYGYVDGYNYPIANIKIDDKSYSGVFLIQTDETNQFSGQNGDSKQRMTFAAIGDNEEVWGSKLSSLPETLNAIDSNLVVDPVIYYHSATSYIYPNGNVISDGSETYEKASYIYINSKYTITNIDDIVTNPECDITLTLDEDKSTDEYKAYKITGTVGEFFYEESTNTKKEGDVSLNVVYKSDTGEEYRETLFSYVMFQPIEAHMSQYMYNYNSVFNPKERSFCYLVKLNNSLGYNGEGNYTLFDQVATNADFYANPGYTENTMAGMSYTKDNTDTYAGSYNYTRSSVSSGTEEHLSSVYPTAEYFIDKSANKGNSESGYWDGEKYIITMTLFSQQGNSSAQKNSTGRYLDTFGVDETNPSISVVNTSGWEQKDITALDGFMTTKSINEDFLEIQGTQSTTIDEGETMYFKFSQGTAPLFTAASYFNVKVNLFDKTTVRDSLNTLTKDENGDALVASNYTIETWDNYQLALRVINSYVNNYKNLEYEGNSSILITSNGIDYNFFYSGGKYYLSAGGATKEIENSSECTSTQEAIVQWLKNYYNDLFPIDVFADFQNECNTAFNILEYQANADFDKKTVTSKYYTQDSIEALFNVMANVNMTSFNNFNYEDDSENYWREIRDAILLGETNRNYVADETDEQLLPKAKDNYILLTNLIKDKIATLRQTLNYDEILTSTSKYITTVQQGVESFDGTNISDDIVYENDRFSTEFNKTHYTDASWNDFIDAYYKALVFIEDTGDYSVNEKDNSAYTYTFSPIDLNENKYADTTVVSNVNNAETIIVDDINTYSEKQEKINELNANLIDAYNNLVLNFYFVVKIPKVLILDGQTGNCNYNIEAAGYLDIDKSVKICPDEEFDLSDTTKIIKASVSQDHTDFADLTDNHQIVAMGNINSQLTAGNWKGIFNFLISCS